MFSISLALWSTAIHYLGLPWCRAFNVECSFPCSSISFKGNVPSNFYFWNRSQTVKLACLYYRWGFSPLTLKHHIGSISIKCSKSLQTFFFWVLFPFQVPEIVICWKSAPFFQISLFKAKQNKNSLRMPNSFSIRFSTKIKGLSIWQH